MGVGPVLPIIDQPADSDLTAIAALSTTAFGRSLLEAANGAAGDTIMGLPSRYVPLSNSPGVIIPPAVAAMASTAESTWFQANANTGVRFSIDRSRRVAGVSMPCTVASGNIEIAIHKVARTAASTHNELAAVKVATSGIIACPTPSTNRIWVPFTAPITLGPGTYVLTLWCDNTTAAFVHNLTNGNLRSGLCAAFSGTSTTATPASGYLYYGGRGFLATIEEDPVQGLGVVVTLGDSITANGAQWMVGSTQADRWASTLYNKGVGGETSSQILARVAADVVALTPAYVVVLAGTNDIGATTPVAATIEANLRAIYNACIAAGARVVAGTIPPRDNTAPGDPLTTTQRNVLLAVNTWIRAQTDVTVVDWNPPLSTGDGYTPNLTLFADHVHPNAAGQVVMGGVLATVLAAL